MNKVNGDRSEMIETKDGWLPRSLLRVEEKRSRGPAGTSVETDYYLGERLVRRDQTFYADSPLSVLTQTGRLQ